MKQDKRLHDILYLNKLLVTAVKPSDCARHAPILQQRGSFSARQVKVRILLLYHVAQVCNAGWNVELIVTKLLPCDLDDPEV